jgi:tricorn protease
MRRLIPVLLLAGLDLDARPPASAEGGPPLLLREPTISRTELVFNYGGDLWIVGRDGGTARHLTSGIGSETSPSFSPDGALVAFNGGYDGNQDVYVVPATGGVPRRLTFHPAAEDVVGWTPDGKSVLFESAANSFYRNAAQLYTVPASGGFPEPLPLVIAFDGAFSPDGKKIAYVPHGLWQKAWKRYRGGQTTPIWIADLADSSVEKIPRENSNDRNPLWVGDTIYFLSDRGGPVSLYEYDTRTKSVRETVESSGYDFKSASAGPGAIVIEQFGAIKLFDLATRATQTLAISVSGDLPEVRPRFAPVEAKAIRGFGLSPKGARAVFEARGEIFSVPTDKGDVRNLTRSPAVADRDPSWSPDGKSIAYFSDERGEYELVIRDQGGLGEVRRVGLGEPPSFFYEPVWSPDGKKIAYSDKRLKLWYVDLEKKAPRHVDTDHYAGFGPTVLGQVWSPDSKWIAYARQLPSGLHGIFVYSLEQGKAHPVTDGMSDAIMPVFDRNGKYLYFTASTDIALATAGIDMSSNERRVTRSVYVAVLSRELPSPLAPESDEEGKAEKKDEDGMKTKADGKAEGKGGKEGKGAKEEKDEEEPVVVRIDLDGIGQRILSLPVPARNYVDMQRGKSGILFLSEGPTVIGADDYPNVRQTIHKFDLEKRKVDKLLDEVHDVAVSFDGSKILYRKGDEWTTAGTDEPPSGDPKPGFGPLKLDAMQVYVEPKAVWKQIYDETWRIERDFFYDPGYHGLDLGKAKKAYAPYLEGIASRGELTYLFEEALGELTVGHLFVNSGDQPEPKKVKGGLLGADYRLENGRYRVARVYDGENWNPGLQAPLTQPGVNVKVGDYILAVNGRELRSSENIYAFFEETAGRQVALRVGPSPDGKGARDVNVVPVESETSLRRLAWIEGNRRKVDELSGGRLAYVYLPNTGFGGYTNFNRYFFAQVGREGVVVDERFNEGGQLADYIIDYLRRPLLSRVTARDGADWSSPSEAIYGPKVMIINETAGSGGDALPWYFRKVKLGPLVGTRTWGGLVGIGGYPELIDGGSVTAPRAAIYGLEGEWEVENRGVAPDYEVHLDPAAYRRGHDAQLEKAVELAMQQLRDNPLPVYKKPAYSNYQAPGALGKN